MAKRAAVNKSQAIRDALAANPDKSPMEIAELLKGKGLKVNGQYVSTIKSNAAKKRRGARRGGRRKAVAGGAGNGMSGVSSALEFIRAAGGLQEAKSALEAIEEIGKVVG